MTKLRHRPALGMLLLAQAAAATLISAAPARAGDAPLEFELVYSEKLHPSPFTGRVMVYLTDKLYGDPGDDHQWPVKQPVFSIDARDWQPGTPLRMKAPRGFPGPLTELPAGEYRMRAVMQVNIAEAHGPDAPGNLRSKWTTRRLDPKASGVVRLKLTRRVKPKAARELRRGERLVELRSDLLSRFYGRDVFHRAIVAVPDGHGDDPGRRWPAVYAITGFGEDHHGSLMLARMLGLRRDGPFVVVALDPSSPQGHHVFADSANNGPRGRALVEEFIPRLEKEFRLLRDARGRFVTGHSSGGWASLWLQVTYPDVFGGCWSGAPDSVTFRDFCAIDLYDAAASANMYRDAAGATRPIMREGNVVVMTLCDEATAEWVVGPGGQFGAFDAVFGPRGPDGRPVPLFDPVSGAVDRAVVEHWRTYDIVELLKRDWPALGPKLRGKITVVMGGEDTFYLEGATKLLKAALEALGSDARITIVEGADHGTVFFAPAYRAFGREMEEKYREAFGEAATKPAKRAAEAVAP